MCVKLMEKSLNLLRHYLIFRSELFFTKNSLRTTTRDYAWTHPTKSSSLIYYLSIVDISMQKIKEIDALLPELSMTRESCCLIEQEHFDILLVKKCFHIYEVWTNKRRILITLILNSFQQKVNKKFY